MAGVLRGVYSYIMHGRCRVLRGAEVHALEIDRRVNIASLSCSEMSATGLVH